MAAWTSPVLVAAIAARVCAGDPDAPVLVLTALVAPLLALLAPPAPRRLPAVIGLVAVASVALLLWANLLLFADAAARLGIARWQSVTLAAAATLLATVWPGAGRRRAAALPLGVAGVAAVALALGFGLGATPWDAWRAAASRPALVFGERSPWVVEGERFERPTALTFTEAQRVTALTPGVYRVVERDAARAAVRDWRLEDGDVLTLRAGDELAVAAGARVRFEAGRRVPGAAASGTAWADPPERGDPRRLVPWLGMMVTLVGGAMALVPGGRRGIRVAGAPGGLLACVVSATCVGVYAAAVAPELPVSGSLAAPLLQPARLLLGPAAAAGVLAVAAGALMLLLLAAAAAWRDRVAGALGGRAVLPLWTAMFALAALASLWPADPWRVASTGLGLAAAAWAAPLLAHAEGAEILGWPAAGVGAAAGALAFGLLAAAAPALPAWAAPAGREPALLAAPLAWGLVRFAAAGVPVGNPRRG